MELSRAVASTALILGVLLIVGHARGGDDGTEAAAAKESEVLQKESRTLQERIRKREEARRAEMLQQQRRTELFDRNCRKPVMTDEELEACREVYRKM